MPESKRGKLKKQRFMWGGGSMGGNLIGPKIPGVLWNKNTNTHILFHAQFTQHMHMQ